MGIFRKPHFNNHQEKVFYILRTSIIVLFFYVFLYIAARWTYFDLERYEYHIYLPISAMIISLLMMLIVFIVRQQKRKAMPLLAGTYWCFIVYLSVFVIRDLTASLCAIWFAFLFLAAILFRKRGFLIFSGMMFISAFLIWWLYLDHTLLYLFDELFPALSCVTVAITAISVAKNLGVAEPLYQNEANKRHLAERRLAVSINSLSEGFITTNQNGRIIINNHGAINLLKEHQSLINKNIFNVFHLFDESGQKIDMKKNLLQTYPLVTRELIHVFNLHHKMNLYLAVAPIFVKSKIRGYTWLFYDITEEKTLSEERDEFISVISHELRTPIAVVEGAVSNLQFILKTGGKLSQLNQQLDSAYQEIRNLEQMINDITMLSRATNTKREYFALLDVNQFLTQIHHEYQPMAEKKDLKFELKLTPGISKVKASEVYLHEILQNLISNAIKYTDKGKVVLSAYEKNNKLEIVVEDTGIGISPEDQKHLFDKFWRSEDWKTRQHQGTGLGLYLVAKLSKLLKIKVVVESKLNQGSKFILKW